MAPPIRTVILDFDGVLAESNDEKTQAFADLFTRYPQYAETMMDYHITNGSISRLHKFEYFADRLFGRPGDQNLIEEMMTGYSELVERRISACPEVPGAMDFLREFSKKVPLYISSQTPQEELHRIAETRGVARYVRKIYGYPPIRKNEAIHRALTSEGVRPEEGLFVGDTMSDFEIARQCGLEFIGRDSGLWPEGFSIKLYHDMYEIGTALQSRLEMNLDQ